MLLVAFLLGFEMAQPVELSAEATSQLAGLDSPSNTSAVALSDSRIAVAWQDNSAKETGFELHRSASGPEGPFTPLAITGPNVTGHSDTGLPPLTEHCYKVRAFRTTGNTTSYSAFSNTACATTSAPPPPGPPNAPSGMDAKPANSSVVDVSWTDNSSDEDGFRVERSLELDATWTSAGTIGPNATSFKDAGRTSEQQVCYRVIAFNVGGDSPPSNTDCTTPPAVPTGLAATGVDGPAIDLTWADNSAVEEGYQVQRATDGVAFSAIADLPANTTTYHDAVVSSNTTHWYQVRAKKDGGFSGFSNGASATAGSCVPTSTTEICDNGLDDDCNGLIDAADPGCAGSSCPYGSCVGDESAGGCPVGFSCNFTGCCESHCGNGFRDSSEGDVDCGWVCSTSCQTGQHCQVDPDCASFSCVNGICQ